MESQPNHPHAIGQLFVVATPIGNLSDITFRAVETLKSVDVIAAEDTRTSLKLLRHYGIDTPMIALHEHNEAAMIDRVQARLEQGESIALISDAGTPLISDPGYRLVRQLRQAGIPVTPIPGASSVMTGLCAAGLATDHFRFAGFLPRSGTARAEAISRITGSDETTVLLESPRRLLETLQQLQSLLDPERELVVARELTKLHEEFVSGTAAGLVEHFTAHEPRGEIVLMIAAASEITVALDDAQILACLNSEAMLALPPSARAKAVAKTLGIPRSRAYALMSSNSE
ncbi:16S rRNA (cytidine(1402)-2'-O)-methyltransferase [Mariprofundus erugo]|uniref:Ribosomal RNA small subunit methyltransferase I n=1 Tax=Mariprofundus erugo TaxID=2528639 RepID=A0A5R9GRX6_9PROT|nr:16S rRNA (cytidine(1402)-2'-O)-methyltransferase [Mariprofundus erugo]TLS68996.1 16S rRNA (cytidine(1402)-2'-O)-methyltransferase [Mariprofundus erugo]TLS74184.1 16S rRNA (cytidine(1402)-2'-O)-methyltransferase [Mariprofundus erugo]